MKSTVIHCLYACVVPSMHKYPDCLGITFKISSIRSMSYAPPITHVQQRPASPPSSSNTNKYPKPLEAPDVDKAGRQPVNSESLEPETPEKQQEARDYTHGDNKRLSPFINLYYLTFNDACSCHIFIFI